MANPSYSSTLEWTCDTENNRSAGYTDVDQRCPGASATNHSYAYINERLKTKKIEKNVQMSIQKKKVVNILTKKMLQNYLQNTSFNVFSFPSLPFKPAVGTAVLPQSVLSTTDPKYKNRPNFQTGSHHIFSQMAYIRMKRSVWKKAIKEHMEERRNSGFLRFCPLPQQAPQFMNSWEISFSQEEDDFLVQIKVETTKIDCITQKKRCFLKEGDRTLHLFIYLFI